MRRAGAISEPTKKLLLVLAIYSCAIALAAQEVGPSAYAARTDRKIVPYAAAPPSIGPAGSVITDPGFGSRLARITDFRSDLRNPGRSLYSPSSSEQNAWNKEIGRAHV